VLWAYGSEFSFKKGARFFRVHDVRPMLKCALMFRMREV